MRVIICPGNSPHNQSMNQEAKKEFSDVIALRWNHWDGQEDKADDYQRVVQAMQANPKAKIIAKSYGGVLVMKAITEYLIANTDITILGALPKAIKKHNIDIKRVDAHVHIIQNEFDPHASYTEVKKYFSNVTCIQENNTHDYSILAVINS